MAQRLDVRLAIFLSAAVSYPFSYARGRKQTGIVLRAEKCADYAPLQLRPRHGFVRAHARSGAPDCERVLLEPRKADRRHTLIFTGTGRDTLVASTT